MAGSDKARVAVWQTATVHDENDRVVSTGGYWADEAGQPITAPDYLRELEQRMASTKGAFDLGDKVVILDDDGNETEMFGTVDQDVGMGTYLVLLDGENRRVGAPASHLQKRED